MAENLERKLPLTEVDKLTREWIRNPSDEMAARNGCRFDLERGQFTVDWIEDYCILYEGDLAGHPMILGDWQLDCTLRMFGWIRWSDKFKRMIRRFREADIYIAKKNTKTPSMAAWAIYLLSGDGEPGQKVFMGAKDGLQIKENAMLHAIKMVEQSERLSEICTINRTTMSIKNSVSNGIITPLSSSTENTQKSKEGLNGSVLLDETHVLDIKFVSRISRAGISRSEPFFIKVSTAGNDPDSYGKKRFDYALQVLAGKVVDQTLFAAIFAAPQDVSDTEIDADPMKYGLMANPAMGRIVDPEEYMSDYNRSRNAGLQDWIDFKIYRLNIWHRSANPWLRYSDWEACKRNVTEESLRGRKCWAGLDLSKTRDMSALSLCFPEEEDEAYSFLFYFWMPDDTANSLQKIAPFWAWGQHGLLKLTPGAVTDYGFIRSTFRRLAEMFEIQGLYFDKTYAEQLTQQISEGEFTADGQEIIPGLGIERTEFPQRMTSLAGPTADFERLILAGKILQPGHPVMDWQIGHVNVYSDANGNKRPIKPKNADDIKKIDGIVAGIMSLAGAMLGNGDERSVYNTRRLLTLGQNIPPTRSERRDGIERQAEAEPSEARPASEPISEEIPAEVGEDASIPEPVLIVRQEPWQRWANGDDLDD